MSSQVDASTNVSVFLSFHVAPAFGAFWERFHEWSLLLKFLLIIFPSHVCHTHQASHWFATASIFKGLMAIAATDSAFAVCSGCGEWLKQLALSAEIIFYLIKWALSDTHSSASLGDLMNFAREMIWQLSKKYVFVLLLNSRFSQSKITCLFFPEESAKMVLFCKVHSYCEAVKYPSESGFCKVQIMVGKHRSGDYSRKCGSWCVTLPALALASSGRQDCSETLSKNMSSISAVESTSLWMVPSFSAFQLTSGVLLCTWFGVRKT